MPFNTRVILAAVALFALFCRHDLPGTGMTLLLWTWIGGTCYRHRHNCPELISIALPTALLCAMTTFHFMFVLVALGFGIVVVAARGKARFLRAAIVFLAFASLIPGMIAACELTYAFAYLRGQHAFERFVTLGTPYTAMRRESSGRWCMVNSPIDLPYTRWCGYRAGLYSRFRTFPEAEQKLRALGARFAPAPQHHRRQVSFPPDSIGPRELDALAVLGDVTWWDLSQQPAMDDDCVLFLVRQRAVIPSLSQIDLRGTQVTINGRHQLRDLFGPGCAVLPVD